jgi:DNA (cytosine-5)-methyltransferase 1
MLTYLAMAEQLKPKWIVWENVPGVLSSNGGKDFGTFLSALGQIGFGFAYRVLDAQYFGVAQRRRRVFVVGYLGDWRRAAAVLFERESLSGHSAPSRETREEVADTLTVGANQYSGFNGEPVAQCLTTRTGSAYDPTTETLPIAFGAQNSASQGSSVSTEVTPTLDKSKVPAVVGTLTRASSAGGTVTQQDINAGHILHSTSAVRRLTPTECERLQGFPDTFTRIPWRKKPAEDCPDGPRYKAMGNSMAVPVMRWIGERIHKQ